MSEGWLPRAAAEIFGEDARAAEAYGVLTVDVPAGDAWPRALLAARDALGCTYFDWLSAVDEPGEGLRVCAHVVALPAPGAPPRRLLLRTTVSHEDAALPTATGVYAGAAWHERETHEMFGIDFPGHPGLAQLLLPDGFEGHPLRKDFVLAARVAKAWPGAKEPGESAHGGPKRRQMLPPGVPDPNDWGPLKGQLGPAPARPARGSAAQRPDRPRRTRSATEGTASQRRAPGAGDAPWRASGPGAAQSGQEASDAGAPRRPPAASDGPAPEARASRGPARDTSRDAAAAARPEPGPGDADDARDAAPDHEPPAAGAHGTGEAGPETVARPGDGPAEVDPETAARPEDGSAPAGEARRRRSRRAPRSGRSPGPGAGPGQAGGPDGSRRDDGDGNGDGGGAGDGGGEGGG